MFVFALLCVNSCAPAEHPPRNRLAVCPSAVNHFSASNNPSALNTRLRLRRRRNTLSEQTNRWSTVCSGVCFPDESGQERNFAGFPWENVSIYRPLRCGEKGRSGPDRATEPGPPPPPTCQCRNHRGVLRKRGIPEKISDAQLRYPENFGIRRRKRSNRVKN